MLYILFLFFIVLGGLYLQYYGNTRDVSLDNSFRPPSVQHPGGTDEVGRDVFQRTIQGASLSLRIAVLAWSVSLFAGLIAGAVAGYFTNSIADIIISALITYAYATPFIIFLIALLGVLGPGLVNAYLILILFAWAAPARQARVIVKGLKTSRYMIAARSFGYSSKEMLAFVIIPQVLKPVLIASLAVLPEIIALDAVLAFFGLGVQPPAPSLGKMITDGINYLSVAWWIVFFPVCILIIICILIRLSANRLSSVVYE